MYKWNNVKRGVQAIFGLKAVLKAVATDIVTLKAKGASACWYQAVV
ncbi:hypothetical protein N5853_10865 [Bartonella sp. HY329]|nr:MULTISPECIES: hypothetical protein [unclassified Bartonella]UXM94597.1 hypothetical protein N5853_10865 [Bartonella sp. HY329]UXN08920.1 hypothetical protein N5852_10875 [Bartonella sp. HY328]